MASSRDKRKAEDIELEDELNLVSFSTLKPSAPLHRDVFAGCRKISEYEKINRLGEGTYGVVCKLAALFCVSSWRGRIPSRA